MTCCQSCGTHVLGAGTCPHCERPSVEPRVRTVAAALLGLTLAGCPVLTGEPEYGATITDTTTDSTPDDTGTEDTGQD